ncbi:MAG: cell division protein FtsW [Firmicutes bacterium]|nr:cell division protein FtsW [Bacillota bacterium]
MTSARTHRKQENIQPGAKKKSHEADFLIVVLTAVLTFFGLTMVYSASLYKSLSKYGHTYHFLKDDFIWMALGWIILIVAAGFPYKRLRMFCYPALAVGEVLLLLIFTPLGIEINNARRWLYFGITVMPGEIIKTCLILFMARYYSDDPNRIKGPLVFRRKAGRLKAVMNWETSRSFLFMMAVMGINFLLIFKQPNLSTAGIVVLLMACIMYVAGLSYLLVTLGITAAGGLVFITAKNIIPLISGYMMKRLDNFWNPWADALGKGFQVCQGLLALGSGGVFGMGLGQSVQKTLYLPEPQNDFILAIIGEELGFAGILALLIVYVLLIWRCFKVAISANDYFGMLLASGVGIHLALQVLLNIAVVTASFPPTGVVLPFVSLGGNATLLFFGEIGIVLNISKTTKQLKESEE